MLTTLLVGTGITVTTTSSPSYTVTVFFSVLATSSPSAQLAAAGAKVTAVERDAKRAARLAENLARVQLPAEIVVADAAQFRPAAPFDAILLDAPCTATGTIRRHPDVAWLKRPRDVTTAATLQLRLLQAAAAMLAPGGRLVFATCSLQAEEGEAHLREAAAFGLRLDPIRPEEVPGLPEAILPSGALRTRPDYWAARGGMDGFFIARFLKG
jgi:16S rRNA (cytosine967-C5)-methyltransferase